jgi:hypothetical protein
MNTALSEKWVFYPWVSNQGFDHLIHPEDLPMIRSYGLGISYCLDDKEDYIKLKFKSVIVRAKKEGVKKILPAPKFDWNQQVLIKSKPSERVEIHDIFWHHKEGEYYYYLLKDGKLDKKRYKEAELDSIN